jgi:hypothetical protein
MSGSSGTGNPLFDMWIAAQRQFLEAQEPLIGKMRGLEMGGGDISDAMRQAEVSWKAAERQAQEWIKSASSWASGEEKPDEGIADETLKRMFDPTRFLYAGSDEVNQAIQRLVEGPEFADIGTLERQILKATKEWLNLREASAEYRAITAAAWSRAFETFSKEVATDPDAMSNGLRAMIDRWLNIANDELIRTQRTDEFLAAQRKLLRAGVDYRLKERELVEVWSETHSIPTRTEIDDLHRIVHDLRSQVRKLKQRVTELETKPKRAAAPRNKAAPAKSQAKAEE